MAEYQLTTPLTDEAMGKLRAGDVVKLTGTIYTARDAAHKRLTLAVMIGIGSIEVVDTGGLSGVQQSFGALFVNGAVGFGGKTHTAVTQKGSADVVFVPVAVFHKLFF